MFLGQPHSVRGRGRFGHHREIGLKSQQRGQRAPQQVPDLARYLVAAGWLLHGVWDFIHLKLDKVVARSFAEWCGVIDVVIAVELVFKV